MDNQDAKGKTNLANLLKNHEEEDFPASEDLFPTLHHPPPLQMQPKNESVAVPSTCDSTQFARHALSRGQSSQAPGEEEQPKQEPLPHLQPTQQFYEQLHSQTQDSWHARLRPEQFQIPSLGRHMSSIQQAENNDHERVKESLSLPQSQLKSDIQDAPRFFQNSTKLDALPESSFPQILSLQKKQSSIFENAKNPQHSLSLLNAKNRSPSSPNVPSPSLGQVARPRHSQGLIESKQPPTLEFKEPQSQIQRHVSFGLRRESSMCSTNPTNEEMRNSFSAQMQPQPRAPPALSCIYEAKQSQEDTISQASRPQPALQMNPLPVLTRQQPVEEESEEDDLAMPVLPPTLTRQISQMPEAPAEEEERDVTVEVNIEDVEEPEDVSDNRSRATLPPTSSLPTNTVLAQAFQVDDLTLNMAPPPLMRTSRNHSQLPSASNSNFDARSRGIQRSSSIPHLAETLEERIERRSRENRQTANLFMEEVISRGSPFYLSRRNNDASAQGDQMEQALEDRADQSQRPRSRLSDLNLNAEVEQMTNEILFGNSSFDGGDEPSIPQALPQLGQLHDPSPEESSSSSGNPSFNSVPFSSAEESEARPPANTSPFISLLRRQQDQRREQDRANEGLFGGPLFSTMPDRMPRPQLFRPPLFRRHENIQNQINMMIAQQEEEQERFEETNRMLREQETLIRDLQNRLNTASRQSQASNRRSGILFSQSSDQNRPNYVPRIFPRLLRQSTFFENRGLQQRRQTRRLREPPIFDLAREQEEEEDDSLDLFQPLGQNIVEGSSEESRAMNQEPIIQEAPQPSAIRENLEAVEDSLYENLMSLNPMFESPHQPERGNRPDYTQQNFLGFLNQGVGPGPDFEHSSSFSSSSSELSFASSSLRRQNNQRPSAPVQPPPPLPPPPQGGNIANGYRRRILGMRSALFNQNRLSQRRAPSRLSFLLNRSPLAEDNDQKQEDPNHYARTKLAIHQEHKRVQMKKAFEMGYDSTFSEVEQVLDGFDASRDEHLLERHYEARRLPFYSAIQESYGVIAVLMVLRMKADATLDKAFLSGGSDVQDLIDSCELESIKEIFYIIFNNVLISVRELRKLIGENDNEDKRIGLNYLLKPQAEMAARAHSCLETILSYFPNYKKIKVFLRKFDRHQKWIQNQIRRAEEASPTESQNSDGEGSIQQLKQQQAEFKKQMRQNRIMLKICLDIRLTLARLKGLDSSPSTTLKLIKQTIRLHKSIKAFESQDFDTCLKMFPNKLRCESSGAQFYGERKIQTLMKEKVIYRASSFKDYIDHYSQLKTTMKASLKQQQQAKEANADGEPEKILGKRSKRSKSSKQKKEGKKRQRVHK